MNIPKKIEIGFRTFDVAVHDKDHLPNMMGSVNNNNRIIYIERGHHAHDMMDTVIHECLHVMVGDSNLVDESDEEKLVATLSNKFTELFVRNPRLLDWMRQQVKETSK